MKIGNTPGVSTFDDSHDLSATMKRWMSPANRQVDPARAVLGSCSAHNKMPEDLLDRFANDLFPMAQGVDTSAATAHCLRFGIEAAKLQVMMLVSTMDTAAVTVVGTETRMFSCGSSPSKAARMGSMVSGNAPLKARTSSSRAMENPRP